MEAMTTRAAGPVRGVALPLYFLGAYALTWVFWVPAALASRQEIGLPVPPAALLVLGGLGPMLAALGVTAWEAGRPGVRALLAAALRWRVRPIWYVVAVPGMALLELAVVPLHLALGRTWPASADDTLALLPSLPLLFLFVALLGGGLDEELSWRGYALPRLQNRHSPQVAALILGPFWACWHLPLWADPALPQARLSFPLFVASTIALSVLFAWIHNDTGGSLLLVILAHASVNVAATMALTLLPVPPDSPLGFQVQVAHTALTALAAVVAMARGFGSRWAAEPPLRKRPSRGAAE